MPEVAQEDAALLLLAEKIAETTRVEAARAWDAECMRGLMALVGEQKDKLEPTDVYLLREVRIGFKEVGMAGMRGRQQAVELLQTHLDPQPTPHDENRALVAKEFLRAAQAGAMYEMMPLLAMHPSVLTARSTTKGYTAMHYAAMAGALPLLVWLVDNGLAPDVRSRPLDESEPVSPLQVALEYRRLDAAERLRVLHDGLAFLAPFPPEATDAARLSAAVEAGSSAAAKVLLWRSAALARAPELHGAGAAGVLHVAAARGHVPVLLELLRHGAAETSPALLQAAQQAAIAARKPEAADLLERF